MTQNKTAHLASEKTIKKKPNENKRGETFGGFVEIIWLLYVCLYHYLNSYRFAAESDNKYYVTGIFFVFIKVESGLFGKTLNFGSKAQYIVPLICEIS